MLQYDIIVGGDALDFFNLNNFTQFLALKCHANSCTWRNVVKKATSNILKPSLLPIVKFFFFSRMKVTALCKGSLFNVKSTSVACWVGLVTKMH